MPVERSYRRDIRHGSVVCRGSENISLDQSDYRVTSATNICGTFRDGVHHRLDFGRRAGDHTQNFTRGGLLFQRFLELLEQPHVLDGDHGLGCEGFKQFDLLVRERADLHAADLNRPDGSCLAQQRRGKHGPNSETSAEARWKVTLWHCCQVIDAKGSAVNYGSAGYRITV
jgi:hypothetical protein